MLIVSNTSPLVGFSAIRRLDLLKAQADQIWIPKAVARELVDRVQGWGAIEPIQKEILQDQWIKTRDLELHLVPSLSVPPFDRLDRGEAEAVALAQHPQKSLLVDDREARKVASQLGLDFFGSLGVIKLAKRKGTISCADVLVRELQDAGIYLGDELVDRFLRNLGER